MSSLDIHDVPNLPQVPSHISHLLNRLHAESIAQETNLTMDFNDPKCKDKLRDKAIAFDKDKAHFVYALCRAIDARTIVEAGTSFGLALVWIPVALTTLKLVQPRLRRGAVIVADSSAAHRDAYKEFFDHVRAPGSGFITQTLPFRDGLEMMVYMPET
ncbi:hypothetical protein CDD82_1193 [Ophiocordyceps australis]|uniref:O-methyltransferase domain-containing protein n=1 Tax=Ophiocordyceps australis TaxID=1399860 RepID=A0A2C5ZPB1_9HYPO|nr:hypothetical protein CDD82_1193 [Ophiocordyceps australis]